MLDEEKEAIEELKNKKADYFMISDLTGKTLLNLIKKQSKEIEELKEKYSKKLIEFQKEREWYEKNHISKDKIKAKIEAKLKELDEQINEEWKKYGNSKELQDMEDMYNFLQSLLEKE